MLPARHRLRDGRDFSTTVRGRRAGGRLMVVHMRVTDASAGRPPRVGFVVSKAVGNAVIRARVKRRLRALMSARIDRLPRGADVVVRANPAAAQAESAELGRALDPLLDKVLRTAPQAQAPVNPGQPSDATSRV